MIDPADEDGVDEDEVKPNVVGILANGDPGTVDGADRAVNVDRADDDGDDNSGPDVGPEPEPDPRASDDVFGEPEKSGDGNPEEGPGLAAPLRLILRSFEILFPTLFDVVDIESPEFCNALIRSAMLPPGLDTGPSGAVGLDLQ